MPVKHISSRENSQFKIWRALADSRHSRRELGRTLLDGEHLLAEALQAGVMPEHLVVDAEAPAMATWQARLPQVPMTSLPSALFASLSPVAAPTGILAVIAVPATSVAAGDGSAVLLDDVQDPGNLGALLRTAAAAGIDDAYLSKGCAEAWSPKALRGGQGGQFHLRIHEAADLVAVARARPGGVYAAALGAERDLYALDLAGPVAFAFGNEGAGLSPALLRESRPFSIPMAGAVESLNVAAAAAVCLFERLRQVRRAEVPS